MNWKLSFANEVRDNFLSSLFMEISFFIWIMHCLYRPHKMPFLLFKLQIIASRIIHWKLESTFLISRKPITNEWGCYLFVTIHKWKLKKDSIFLTYLLWHYLSKFTSECERATYRWEQLPFFSFFLLSTNEMPAHFNKWVPTMGKALWGEVRGKC